MLRPKLVHFLFLAVTICYLVGVGVFRYHNAEEGDISLFVSKPVTRYRPAQRTEPQVIQPLAPPFENFRTIPVINHKDDVNFEPQQKKKIDDFVPQHVDEILSKRNNDIEKNPVNQIKNNAVVSAPPPPPAKSVADESYDLVIGIPTVPRRNNEDYLLKTLAGLDGEMKRTQLKILVVVVTHASTHIIYDQALELYKNDPRFYFSKVERLIEPNPEMGDVNDFDNQDDKPGTKVRQQTADNVNMFRFILSHSLQMKHYLMMEDDFVICNEGMQKIEHSLGTADKLRPNWLAIRYSYGLNGLLVKGGDLQAFSDWCWRKIAWKPPDILFIEWIAGVEGRSTHGSRPHFTYKENLFTHIGFVSSLRDTRLAHFPGCGEGLNAVVWSCEFFQAQCPELSPC